MRVLRVIARLNIGGPARHTVILDEGLRRRGVDTLLVHGSLAEGEGSLEGLAAERQVPVRRIPQLGRRISPWDDFRAFWSILRLIRQWQPDVVHTHTAKAGALGRLAGFVHNACSRRRSRCAVIHTFHGHVFAGYFPPAASALVRVAERVLARLTDMIVTISPAQRDDIVSRFGIAPAPRVTIVPLGLELNSLLETEGVSPLRAEITAGPDDFVIGYVGRLVPIKNPEALIRAAALARDRVEALRVIVAGGGELETSLRALAAELHIADRVHFLGWRRDLANVYRAMDVFVLTSLNEGTPVALIEAMAAGVPVIATDVGGIPDVVDHGVTGVVLGTSAPELIADAIVAVASDRAQAATMAGAARPTVAARYGAERLVDEMQALYTKVLAEKRTPPGGRDSQASPA